jgi:glycosyltransferase involved in cell wall biosynthesis
LAVVATDTRGQREIAAQAAGAVQLCGAEDPAGLAKILNGLAADRAVLRRAMAEGRQVAKKRFCWEKEAQKIVRLVSA